MEPTPAPAHPRCLWCQRPLRSWYGQPGRTGYNGQNAFCSMRHGYWYAEKLAQRMRRSSLLRAQVEKAVHG